MPGGITATLRAPVAAPADARRRCAAAVRGGSGRPSGPHGAAIRKPAAALAFDATGDAVGAVPQSSAALRGAYSVLTRAMMCCTDVSSRRRNGAGYRPIQNARISSGANVANSRWLRSSRCSFFGFSTLPNIVRWIEVEHVRGAEHDAAAPRTPPTSCWRRRRPAESSARR